MTTIETSKVNSPNSIDSLFGFLNSLDNFKLILPEDKIENWKADSQSCSFNVIGLSKIALRKKSEEAPHKITISSNGKVPFDFEFDILLSETSADETQVQLIFSGKINPFMKMMVEKPLRSFFEELIQKSSKISL